MTTALVIGANGQDGTFLTRHLVARGCRVVGVGRQEAARFAISSPGFSYHQIDLRSPDRLRELLEMKRPDRIFHVAAVHMSAGAIYEPVFDEMLQVNVSTAHAIVEHLRSTNRGARFMYASSAKVFGDPYPAVINEKTPTKSTCLYSITKNAAYSLIDHYRRNHGIQGSVAYLFNHESELRPERYFFPKLLSCLMAAKRGSNSKTSLTSLEFHCDWGSAEEYMEFMVDMLERAPGEDFVLATGTCTYARDFVRALFAKHGLDYRHFVEEKVTPEAQGGEPYTVELTKLRSLLGRVPGVGIGDVVDKMLDLFSSSDARSPLPKPP